MWSVPKSYLQDIWGDPVSGGSSVEVGSNTSTAALRVVGGDEKGTQCLEYNRATLFLGDINTGTWTSSLGSLESQTVKCGRQSRETRT
jgi:hypothetical protein